ncbi:MAG: glycosyltransferase family 39 protein [Nitrospirae bacterium]|nr:glycosyltransferase family 39 protein [Nitrospirota bacterium]
MKKNVPFIIVLALTVLTFLLLYTFRTLDDNRLTSWESVFGAVSFVRILALLVPGCILAFMLSHSTVPERYPVLFLFIMSFAAAALLWREPEMNVDASRYFTQAKHLELFGAGWFFREWGNTIAAWTDLPLMPFIYGLVFKYTGEGRMHIQIITTLLFSFTVVLTYLMGKTLWDRETGFLGGMSLLGIPFIFTQVPLMLVDTSTMFFFTLAVYAYIKALERGGIWIAAASAALFLAFFSKYSAWLMFSLLGVIAAVRLLEAYRTPGDPPIRSCCFRIIAPVLTGTLIAGAVMLLKYNVFATQIGLLVSFQGPGLRRWGESFVSTLLFQTHPFVTAAAVLSVYTAWKKKDPKLFIAGWLIVLLFALQIKRIRYTIVAFPMLSLMAAYGLNAVRDRGLQRYIAFSAASCSIIIAAFAYLPFLQQTSAQNLQNAGAFLATLPGKNIEVVTLPGKDDEVNIAVYVPVLDIFTHKRIHYNYHPEYVPQPEEIAISSFRFSWIYRNPEYYAGNPPPSEAAVAVIAGGPIPALPEEVAAKVNKFGNSKAFAITDDVFDRQTLVTVYY